MIIKVMMTTFLTGATSGLGARLALDLATRRHRLVLHGRDESRLAEISERARAAGGTVTTVLADISDPVQVAQLCDRICAQHTPLDLIINNAAAGGGREPSKRETNVHGTELRMACNVLAPHLITRRLASAMAPGGRVVQVGSLGQAPLDVDDLEFTREYDGLNAYCRSKLALIMDAMEFAANGTWVNVVHPADRMPTTMVRDSGFVPATTVDDGALPVLRVALDTELVDTTGRYFHRFDLRDPHPQAQDESVRAGLRSWIEQTLAASLG